MKKLLGLFAAISLFATTSVNVVACEENGDIKNDDPNENLKRDISKIDGNLNKIDLKLETNFLLTEKYIFEVIKSRIKNLYGFEILDNEIEIKDMTDKSANIFAQSWSEKIKGEKSLTFTTRKDLGSIESLGQIVLKAPFELKNEHILAKLNLISDNLKISAADIYINIYGEDEKGVQIYATNNKKFIGEPDFKLISVNGRAVKRDLSTIEESELELDLTQEATKEEIFNKTIEKLIAIYPHLQLDKAKEENRQVLYLVSEDKKNITIKKGSDNNNANRYIGEKTFNLKFKERF